MIKVENIDVWGFEHAIRGCRNPMNSWAKSDSSFQSERCGYAHNIMGEDFELLDDDPTIGDNDLDLMRRLYQAGTEHRKYLRQIMVSMDITAPTYFNAEFDTYKVGVVRNSCSFMHKGVSEPFTINDFSVHNDDIYKILSPLSEKQYPLHYQYETDEYKDYICNNGRKYKIFKNGRVVAYPFEYTDTKGRHRIFSERECIPSVTKNGYYELNLGGKNDEKWLLHRLVATVWIDNPNNLYTVDHIDNNKGNNCVENLQWRTLSDNIKKGFKDGLYENTKSLHTQYIKWKNGHRVVSPYIKSQILRDHNNGMTCRELGQKYNISMHQANNMISIAECDNSDLFMYCYIWETIIDTLNQLRDEYLETKDDQIFQQIRCLLPCGYNQKYTITMNYENVVTIIKQRSGHKLDEWNDFVKILKDLPYVKDITEVR